MPWWSGRLSGGWGSRRGVVYSHHLVNGERRKRDPSGTEAAARGTANGTNGTPFGTEWPSSVRPSAGSRGGAGEGRTSRAVKPSERLAFACCYYRGFISQGVAGNAGEGPRGRWGAESGSRGVRDGISKEVGGEGGRAPLAKKSQPGEAVAPPTQVENLCHRDGPKELRLQATEATEGPALREAAGLPTEVGRLRHEERRRPAGMGGVGWGRTRRSCRTDAERL